MLPMCSAVQIAVPHVCVLPAAYNKAGALKPVYNYC